MSLGSNGLDQEHSLQKNSNKTSWHELLDYLHQFGVFCSKFCATAKRFQMHPNGKKCTKT